MLEWLVNLNACAQHGARQIKQFRSFLPSRHSPSHVPLCSRPEPVSPIWRRRWPPKPTAPLSCRCRAPTSCPSGSANRRSWWSRCSRWHATAGPPSSSSTRSTRCAARALRTSRSRRGASKQSSSCRCRALAPRTTTCLCSQPPTSPGAWIPPFGVGEPPF